MATAASEKPKKMTKLDIQNALKPRLDDARDFIDEDIAPQRERATRYYQGQPFGDEVDGRSKAVARTVHDSVNGILPSLVDVFLADPDIVQYLPNRADHIRFAEQASDYIPYLLKADNDAFTVLYCAMKDALVRKAGFLKWWPEEEECVYVDAYTGQSDVQIQALLDENYGGNASLIEKVELEPGEAPAESIDPQTGAPVPAFDIKIERRVVKKRFRLEAVPPEEVLVHRKARNSVYSSPVIAHRTYKTVSDLVEMDYDFKEMVELSGNVDEFDFNQEREARTPHVDIDKAEDTPDPSQRLVLYVESWTRMDINGDGIAELVKICTGGTGYRVLRHEAVDEITLAVLSPDPEPHTFFGSCTADVTMDIQRQQSQLLRGMFDSLAQSLNPRMGYVLGQVQVEDLLNNEVGGLIGMRAPGMVQPVVTPFVGQSVLPIMEMLDGIVESRTGQTKASAGLDPDALQSTTKAAVSATVQAAQERKKLIARIFAETGFRAAFRGFLKMVVKNQDAPRIARLRGQFVAVDPRGWDPDMDVTLDVGLGTGNVEEQAATLQLIAAKQEQILTTLGPVNPLVTPTQYYNTLRKLVRLAKIGLPEEFFNNPALAPPPEAAPPEQGAQPDPAAALAQAEIQKAQLQAQVDMRKAEMDNATKMQIAQMQDARERDKMQLQLAIEQIKAGVAVSTARIDADVATANDERADARERDSNEMGAAVEHANNVMGARAAAQQAPNIPE